MYNKFDDLSMMGNWISQGQEKLIDRYVVSVDLAKPETFTLELTQEELDREYVDEPRAAKLLKITPNPELIACHELSITFKLSALLMILVIVSLLCNLGLGSLLPSL